MTPDISEIVHRIRMEADEAESFAYLNCARRLRDAADTIQRLSERIEEWRAARQDVFDNTTKVSAENDGRWKRLSDAEHALMDMARSVPAKGESDGSS